ncbi:MAG: paraquat-inducible protein A [Chlamydiota bacterium]|nr:paraquat-inducible protein A [Chlamydiota bacterium]
MCKNIRLLFSNRSFYFTLIFVCLLASFLLNIFALIVPFIDVRKVLHPVTHYNLIRSIFLMWDNGLVILAIIVVICSIIFPFAKLTVLASGLLHFKRVNTDAFLIKWVEILGKWSMVDVFIVCFILALTNDQVFVDSRPRIGLYAFILAIMLSLISGSLLIQSLHSEAQGKTFAHKSRPPLWYGIVVVLSALGWLGVLVLPFVSIDDWLLRDHAFTVATFIWAISQQRAPLIAVVLVSFLVLIPALELILDWSIWYGLRHGQTCSLRRFAVNLIRPWSMIDVFLIALIIFLLEGQSLMTLEPGWGIVMLVMIVVINGLKAFARVRLFRT